MSSLVVCNRIKRWLQSLSMIEHCHIWLIEVVDSSFRYYHNVKVKLNVVRENIDSIDYILWYYSIWPFNQPFIRRDFHPTDAMKTHISYPEWWCFSSITKNPYLKKTHLFIPCRHHRNWKQTPKIWFQWHVPRRYTMTNPIYRV